MSRRGAIYLLTILLTVATAFGIVATGPLLARPADSALGRDETRQDVLDFYDAVNQVIRTGNIGALDEIVAPDIVIHGKLSHLAPDRIGLNRYLVGLHNTLHRFELTVHDVVTTGDRAVVNISQPDANDVKLHGSSIEGAMAWGVVEALRVRDHQIVEFWSGASAPVLFESRDQAPFAADTPEATLTLDRLTITVGGSFDASGTEERRWLYVEVGSATVASVRREQSETIILGSFETTMRSQSGASEPLNPTILEAGDLVELPIWSRTEIGNVGHSPASMLVLAAGFMGNVGSIGSDPARHGNQSPTEYESGWPGWSGRALRISDSGAMLASLIGNAQTTLPDDQAVLAVSQVILAPGSAISTQVSGPQLLVVDAGMLGLVSEREPAWIQHDRGSDLHVGALSSGAGALIRTDSVVHLRNTGAEPAAITIISIVPTRKYLDDAV